MKKRIASVLLAAGILGALPAQAAAIVHNYDVDKIQLGDTMKKVTKRLGEPHQVVSQEKLPTGQEQVTWRYDVAADARGGGNLFASLGSFVYMPPRVDEYGQYHQGSIAGGIIGEDAGQAARNRQAYFNTPQGQAARAQVDAANPPSPGKSVCLVTFVDRKVTAIKKQNA